MFDAIANLFRNADPTPAASAPDAKLALAALLVDAALRDDSYDETERAAIDRILMAEHGLDAKAATDLRRKAEVAQDRAVGLFRFTQALKEATPFEERITIIEHLWDVALADEDRDAAEDRLIRQVCGLLGVPDKESGLARQRMEARRAG